jgi:hypothetical protein
MAIVKPSYSTLQTLTVPGLYVLANTASATETAEHDNTTDLFIDGELTCQFSAGGATTGFVDVYMLEGNETGVLSTTAKNSNMRRIGSVELNGTTPVTKTFSISELPPFYKFHFYNGSGAALASETVKFRGVNYTDV